MLNMITVLWIAEKEASKIFWTFFQFTVTISEKFEAIVVADDKNCLAELTVALKLNQGVRQRLYIVAGVLFFGSFFCTSKRKNIILIEVEVENPVYFSLSWNKEK